MQNRHPKNEYTPKKRSKYRSNLFLVWLLCYILADLERNPTSAPDTANFNKRCTQIDLVRLRISARVEG